MAVMQCGEAEQLSGRVQEVAGGFRRSKSETMLGRLQNIYAQACSTCARRHVIISTACPSTSSCQLFLIDEQLIPPRPFWKPRLIPLLIFPRASDIAS